jgi:hypothetical protein
MPPTKLIVNRRHEVQFGTHAVGAILSWLASLPITELPVTLTSGSTKTRRREGWAVEHHD